MYFLKTAAKDYDYSTANKSGKLYFPLSEKYSKTTM